MSAVLEIALGYQAAGLSVIPVRADGTKAPAEAGWRAYSERHATSEELTHWFGNGHVYGIGITGGPASGNLAVLDFETDAAYVAWLRSLPKASQDLTRRCPLVRTPGGGAHLYVRLTDPVPGTVLARHIPNPDDVDTRTGKPRIRTKIEVRGDGEQVVAPGSPACCHKSGSEYEWLRRAWLERGVCEPLDLGEWFSWLEAAAVLNEVEPEPEQPLPAAPKPRPAEAGTKPGDDFNRRGTLEETGLFAAGWTWFRPLDGGRGFLTRPGKKRSEGKSATFGLVTAKDGGHPLFYPFTTDCAPFEPRQSYSLFRVYAILQHKGDFEAAARALGQRGYGDQSRGRGPTPTFTGGQQAVGNPGGEEKPHPQQEPKYRFIDHSEFRQTDYRVEWLVDWFLAAKQPAVVAGPSKGMKTSVLVDLAISLATATPHLGKWNVARRVRTAIVSGESGGFTLQETMRRVLAARQLPEDAPDEWLKWEFTLPTFADLIDTADFADRLGALECELVIIDPFYLCLGPIDAKNMFEMGQSLRAVGDLLLKKHGVTPVIAHHANRLLAAGEPMELQHLAYSGLEQFLRQYVFLNRREAYENDGRHELWYRYGGSVGHSGLYRVAIDEGVLGPDTPVRRWDVEVTTPTAARAHDREVKRREDRAEAATQSDLDDRDVLQAIRDEIDEGKGAPTREGIKKRTGLSPDRVKDATDRLKGRHVIEQIKVVRASNDKGGTRQYDGFRPMADDG